LQIEEGTQQTRESQDVVKTPLFVRKHSNANQKGREGEEKDSGSSFVSSTFIVQKQKLLPDDFKFDVEQELRCIRFSSEIAEAQEAFISSLVKANKYRTSI